MPAPRRHLLAGSSGRCPFVMSSVSCWGDSVTLYRPGGFKRRHARHTPWTPCVRATRSGGTQIYSPLGAHTVRTDRGANVRPTRRANPPISIAPPASPPMRRRCSARLCRPSTFRPPRRSTLRVSRGATTSPRARTAHDQPLIETATESPSAGRHAVVCTLVASSSLTLTASRTAARTAPASSSHSGQALAPGYDGWASTETVITEHCLIDPDTGWYWLGGTKMSGYADGGGGLRLVHRHALAAYLGLETLGAGTVHHTCPGANRLTRRCLAPEHLRL